MRGWRASQSRDNVTQWRMNTRLQGLVTVTFGGLFQYMLYVVSWILRIMAGDSRDTWRIHYTLPAYRGSEKHFREEWGVIVWVVWVAAWWQGPLPGILWLGSWQPSVQSPHILQIEFQAFGSREMSIASKDVLSLLSTSLYFLTCSYSL